MGKNIIVRGFTCAFALVLCVTSITGCGKNKNAVAGIAGSETAQNGKEYIYEMEKLDGILLEGEALNSLVYVNGKVRGIGAIGGRKLRCISFNPDGTDVQAFYIDSDKDFRQDRAVFDDEGNLYIKVRERSQSEGEEDNEDFSSEEKYYLLKFDSTGKELYRTDLSEKFSKGAENIDLMSYSKKYGLILVMDQGVMTYDETNGYNKIKPKFISNLQSVVKLSDTQLLLEYDSGGLLELFDLDTKEVKRDLIKRMSDNTYYKYFQCADNVYMSNYEGVYSLDTDSFKIEKLLDYNLSQISDFISEIVAIEGDEFITTTSNRSGNNFVYRLYKADPKDIDEKNYITFGAVSFSPNSLNAIREFNKTNDTYQIKMIDYSELYPNDPWGQLDLDIISGKMPDLIELGWLDDYTKKKYIEKGVFLDLTQAFSKGGALEDIELLPNIAEVMEVDGKIYTFASIFTFDTCMIRTGLADGKKTFTYEDCDNLIKSAGTDYDIAFGMYDNSSLILSRILKYYIDMFIDKEKGNCNFRDSRFIDLLNFAARFPAKKTDNIDFFRDRFYDDDRAIFYLEDICEADEYARLKQCVFHDGVEFIGMPNNSGKNMASISVPICAVNSKTKHSDVIFDLIREIMLSEDEDNRNSFSTVKPIFEKQLQEATKEKKESDINYYGIDEANDVTVKMEPLSQDEVQKIYDYVLSIKTLNPRNEVVEKIINEEAAAFFGGQKTAEEVAELIQNRVTTYLNENS